MHRSRLSTLIIDSQVDSLDEAATFWSKALGHDCLESDLPCAATYTHLDVPEDQPGIMIQKVDHPSRVHLDIETDNIAAEVARLKTLGATVVKEFEDWTVMHAPTGHNFCVAEPQRGEFEKATDLNTWE